MRYKKTHFAENLYGDTTMRTMRLEINIFQTEEEARKEVA